MLEYVNKGNSSKPLFESHKSTTTFEHYEPIMKAEETRQNDNDTYINIRLPASTDMPAPDLS